MIITELQYNSEHFKTIFDEVFCDEKFSVDL